MYVGCMWVVKDEQEFSRQVKRLGKGVGLSVLVCVCVVYICSVHVCVLCVYMCVYICVVCTGQRLTLAPLLYHSSLMLTG